MKELVEFYDSVTLPTEIQLDVCTRIVDVDKFVKNHISYLQNNSGKKRFMGYYLRLVKLKDKLNKI